MGDQRKFMDFDAVFAERRVEPIRFRLLERDWELPGAMPAAVPLRIARLVAEGRGTDDLTGAEVLELAADIVPRPVLTEWLNLGLDEERLGEVIVWLVSQYVAASSTDGDVGEAQAPAEAAGAPASSSNGGPSSKPTSPASTASTSAAS